MSTRPKSYFGEKAEIGQFQTMAGVVGIDILPEPRLRSI